MATVRSTTAEIVGFHTLTFNQILVCEKVGVQQYSDTVVYNLKQIGYSVIINLRGNNTG